MQTKITIIIDNPDDPVSFERHFRSVLGLARALPGQVRLESSRIWPREDGMPTPAHRTLEIYYEDYYSAASAVAAPEARAFYQRLTDIGGMFTEFFFEVEQQ
jgi:hypothetical protein